MDLYGIDLNLLVAFEALMAERNVTRAGARIHRSQPAMSAALSRLRTLLKDELFVRGPEGLQPTPRALDLSEPLGRALAQIQRALDFTQAFEPGASSAGYTIGLSEHPAHVLLPRLLARLRTEAPGVTLRVRSVVARDDALALLDAGEIDLAVGVPPTTAAGRILARPLFEERFVCILRRDHPAGRRRLTLEAWLALTHLLVSPENERFGLVDAALSKLGLRRRLGLTLPQMYAAPALVAGSDLVATVMAGVVQACGLSSSLRVLAPPIELPTVRFDLFWHRRNDAHPAQRWLRECIASLHA